VFGKSLFQPEYRIFKKALEEKLPKEAVIRLFDNQKEIQKLNVSPSALIKEMAKNLNKKLDIDCEPEGTNHVDLFLIANEEGMQHCCWIKSTSRLLSSQKN